MVMSLHARASWRHLLRHPWLMGLLILGVALGVAVVVSVDLANTSAGRAFSLSVENVTGRTTHHIIGGPTGFPESLYTELRLDLGIRASAPAMEGYVEARGETLRLLGLDPFAEAGFRGEVSGVTQENAERLITDPAAMLMAETTARRMGIEPGDSLLLEVPGQVREMTVVGLLSAEGQSDAAMEGLVIADIATAQETLGRIGRLDRIDLILPEGDPSVSAIEAWLPPGVKLVTAQARSSATSQMTRAFRLNLQSMSFLALIVGMFLIYNTMTFAVLRRRNMIGTLRVLGVTRQEVFVQVLIEAVLVGLVGTVVGLALGYLLAQGLVRMVTSTINDLYFVLVVNQLLVSPLPFVKGLALGVGASIAAAIPPALEATWSPPQTAQRRSIVESRVHVLVRWLFVGGLLIMLAAWGLLGLPSKSLILGFAAMFLLILGFSLATPVLVIIVARLAGRLFGLVAGIPGRLSARGVAVALSRTGIAIAALCVAVSATVGVGVMIGSFRATVDDWITQTLQSDIYVSVPHPVASRADGTLPPEVRGRLDRIEGITGMTLRRLVQVESPMGPTQLLAIQPPENTFRGYRLKKGDPNTLWPPFEKGEVVLVSEPYAYRHEVTVGDRVSLMTASGLEEFKVGGVFYDYSADQGMVMMHLNQYQQHWNDPDISSVGLDIEAGTSVDAVLADIRAELADIPRVLVRATGEIRETSLDVFDRTFTITNVLRMLATLVAFVGVLSAMMALQLERTRELAVLRATGITPRQLWGMVSTQTGLMGLTAGLLALPLGLLMSSVLIDVINTRSFGWSMQTTIPWHTLGEALLIALGAALLAGIYPAWRMARTPPAAALREE